LKKHSENLSEIKVLMIGPYPPPYGGIAVVVRDLMNSTLKDDFDMKLLRTTPKGKNEVYRFLSDIKNLFEELIKFKPDIVHIHTSYDWGWPKHITYAFISKLFGKKIVLHHHGIPEDSNYLRGGKLRYIYPTKLGLGLSDHIIAISEKIGIIISKVTSDKKVTVVRNGVNENIIQIGKNRNLPLIKEKLSILYMGRISKRKGIIEFLEMIKKMNMSENIKATYTIVGNGPLNGYAEEFINKNNLSEIIDRRKFVSEEEKEKILKENDVFVLQSDHEGLPIAILEAMASGLIIITTPVGGIPDAVHEKENGLLIKPHDVKSLTDAVGWILNHPKESLQIRENNIKKVSKDYSWAKNTKTISKIYKTLVSGK